MSRQEILLSNQYDAARFVNKMEKYPYNADLLCGSRMVDAKSLLGIMGFGIGKVLTLQVYGDDDKGLLSDISDYLVNMPST